MKQVDGETTLNLLGMDYLKEASTFGALSSEAIKELMTKGTIYLLQPGDLLFRVGDSGNSFFVVLKGTIEYHHALEDGYEQLNELNYGDLIGFVNLITLTSRLGTATAATESYVLEVSDDLFYALHCERPVDFGLLLLNLARDMGRRIIYLATHWAKQKHELHN
ncbi:hypothetical protein GCM10011352_04590 [Marinobacterium zhoushanense]|uniref:Cyclic nucleotide-binding domain-containing protein n=1 Tax=Marinobacterium zhoushanense TaxID=1679163 RepID=A0ABQ1K2J7_9GAMM|nr:cyclic nucleotide-binding domain-containing protein [Marinobacterium zhoushanense]GGB81897.1 hypothetical protein GCM10011352_04590 [Marinobacterium zhoushanense]